MLRGEVGDDGFGLGGTHHLGQVGFGLEFYFFDAAELEQEVAGGFLADAGDVGELGAEGAFAAFVLVERDGKAVNLILYLFEQVEERVGGFEPHHLGREAIEQFGGVVAVVLGQSGDGYFEVELVLYDLSCHLHLSPATVDYQQLGEGFALLGEAFVAPIDYLRHRGVVVGAFDGFDIELAVLLAVGFAAREAYHGGHGEGSLDIGVVETLDVDGQLGQAECFLDTLQQVLVSVVHAALIGVDQCPLVAALDLVGFDVAQG